MNTVLAPSDAEVSHMRERFFDALPASQRRRRRRTSLVVLLSVGAVVAGATTAGAIVQSIASVDQRNTSFDCYTSTDLGSPHGTTVRVDDGRDTTRLTSLADRVSTAVQTCEAGYIAIPTDPEPGWAPTIVPNPTACLLGDGRIAVLPNKYGTTAAKFCDALGLAAPAL